MCEPKKRFTLDEVEVMMCNIRTFLRRSALLCLITLIWLLSAMSLCVGRRYPNKLEILIGVPGVIVASLFLLKWIYGIVGALEDYGFLKKKRKEMISNGVK